ISFARHDDRVHIYVDDEGPGVQLADRVRIFDRFTRAGADAGRRDIAKGVGLGLSLVKEHIRMHDGTVWVTDRPDGLPGARFVIDMPIDDTEMGDEEMAT
ncbi:MAG: ATP-binding protein, partial [Acidimicrobiales bacterium]